MDTEFSLTKESFNTKFAPLAALGLYFRQDGSLKSFDQVTCESGQADFAPATKLIQVLCSILAGCEYVYEVNSCLRSEKLLAHAWGFERYLEQSSLASGLNELSRTNLDQLEQVSRSIWRLHSRSLSHDWRGFLRLELDLSGLPCGKQAEESEKGYFSGEKNATGRQLARVSATQYAETIWSELYAGSRPSVSCLQPAVLAAESIFGLAPGEAAPKSAFDLASKEAAPKSSFDLAADRRRWVLWRVDGGFGSDDKLIWLLARNYQLIAKGFSGRRAEKLARQVTRWNPYGDAWLGSVASPVDFGRDVFVWVKRRVEKGQFKHSYYLTTLKLHSLHAAMALYDQRGGTEVEQFRNDKQGLHLSARRKHAFLAQKALVLLTDMAHNLLTDFHHRALVGSPFADYAAKRIVRDLLAIEGNLVWEGERLVRVELCQANPYAKSFLDCLVRYCNGEKGVG